VVQLALQPGKNVDTLTRPGKRLLSIGTREGLAHCLASPLARPVRLAYQPPANSTFLSEQTSHQQPASSTLLSEQTSTNHQHQPTEQAQSSPKRIGDVVIRRKFAVEKGNFQVNKIK
jgi:hypothetical protein